MPVVFEKPTDLSEYLFRIVDNGGSTADRYTVAFSDGDCLCLSSNPSHPQGVSQSGEDLDPATLEDWVEDGEAVDLALGDLPERIVRHVLARCNEGLADFLAKVEAKDPREVAASRDAADVNEGLRTDLGKGIYHDGTGYRIRLDGPPEDDRGPFETAREVVLASLPDIHAHAGPEYHSGVDDLMRMEPSKAVREKVAELEARREAGTAPGM